MAAASTLSTFERLANVPVSYGLNELGYRTALPRPDRDSLGPEDDTDPGVFDHITARRCLCCGTDLDANDQHLADRCIPLPVLTAWLGSRMPADQAAAIVKALLRAK